MMGPRLKIFTWHIHGSYLYYLSQGNYDIYIPVTDKREEGYYGRGATFPFGDNVHEVAASEVRTLSFDCILFQSKKNFLSDQYDILSEAQRQLPCIYLEHDPPWDHPTDAIHVMNDPDVIMVHVTHFNALMWNHVTDDVYVIEHGIDHKPQLYTGRKEKGIVIVNHLHQRGRKAGADLFETVKKHLPIDLVGMGTEAYGGLGEILYPDLAGFISEYRFVFNPMRYTSLGLALLEAMMIGMPVVAVGTTEYANVVKNGVTGFVHTDIFYLMEKMKWLLNNETPAVRMGEAGRKMCQERFGIERFTREWENMFRSAITKTKNSIYEKATGFY